MGGRRTLTLYGIEVSPDLVSGVTDSVIDEVSAWQARPLEPTYATMLALIFKLGQEAEKSWRRIRGFDHLTKVITGVRFKEGVEVKEEIQQRSRTAA